VLDRAAANNPFATWNMVFVPYCTGDVHGGDNVVTYTAGSTTKTFHHTGHRNFVAFLRRLAVTFQTPGQVVLTGSSAGGFGATLNYDTFRATWPGPTGSLIDDSGPLLVGDAVAKPLRDAWYTQWNLGALADPLCGQTCRGDLSQVWSVLATKHPTDRLSLLSSLQDQTIRAYLSLSATQFQAAILDLDSSRLEAAGTNGRTRVFYIPGSSHTMLGNMGAFSQNGVSLTTFLQQQVSGAAWVSQKP
jgi:hypothetical protein